ncbi:MAG TPA: hypothetical protein VG900_11130 [Hyphomicrobiaceae bacterium]|jgi:hypothetical protein|nr:hypothetical protein [Hyphomicrobiaceae bacterium]
MTAMLTATSWRRVAAIAIGAVALVAGSAYAAGPFNELNGAWIGSGHVRLEDGRRESLRCKAYYAPRHSGDSLGLSLRCASASNRIELRAELVARGSRVRGSWEERTFNASGRVSGVASGHRIRLSIDGGGLAGSMTVMTTGHRQSITVRTDGSAALRGINISMRRE